MLPGPSWAILTDPVCGRSVEFDSPHRAVFGGALFAFCSVDCRAKFAEGPAQFALTGNAATPVTPVLATANAAARSAPAPTAAAAAAPTVAFTEPSTAASAPRSPHEPVPESSPMPMSNVAPASRAAPAAAVASALAQPEPAMPSWVTLPPAEALDGPRGLLSWWLSRREHRFAAECSRQMLVLHAEVHARHPNLAGTALYRRIVAARLPGNEPTANAVLQLAQQSFAIWPVERELNFRDLVHYLAVTQYLAEHPGSRWIRADVKRVVESLVPAGL
jgi:YHS domain-containing protein